MMPAENSSNSIISFDGSSTSSSDSYSYLLQDVENPENCIKEEWEAIERTLYQEAGKQVTNPLLIKECKLWRDSFPYLRVKGNQCGRTEGTSDKSENKGVQTLKNQCNLEKIKNQVVGHIVQGLIAKFALKKENLIRIPQLNEKSRIGELGLLKVANTENEMNQKVITNAQVGQKVGKQCYFERGKPKKDSELQAEDLSLPERKSAPISDDLSDFSDWEKEFDLYTSKAIKIGDASALSKTTKTCTTSSQLNLRRSTASPNSSKNEDRLKAGNVTLKMSEKAQPSRLKTDRLTNNFSSLAQPFEMTKKIDKKYESILENILQNVGGYKISQKSNQVAPSKVQPKSYRDSLEKLRNGFNYEDYIKRNQQSRRINKLNNNWIARADVVDDYSGHFMEQIKEARGGRLTDSGDNRWISTKEQAEDSEYAQLLEELKKETRCKHTKRTTAEEEANMQKPKLFTKIRENATGKSLKSSSCGDLSRKEGSTANRSRKCGYEKGKSDAAPKKTGKPGKTTKANTSRNVQLPPIESGIICTELTGRPKIASKTVPRKR